MECQHCKKHFTSKSNLNFHMKTAKYCLISGRLFTDRQKMGLSQKALARKIGCHESRYGVIEQGYYSPDLFFIDGWSNITGVDIKDLFQLVIKEKVKVQSEHYKRKWKKFKKENIKNG